MSVKQRTLKETIRLTGIGLHTGEIVNLEICPAPDNHGYKFQRTDLEGEPIIKADCDLVTDTSRGTTLQVGDAKVSTVEHILAALVGMGVDNVLIELNLEDDFRFIQSSPEQKLNLELTRKYKINQVIGLIEDKVKIRKCGLGNQNVLIVENNETSIFIGKDGNIWSIHTGFNGPATGEAYTNFKNKIRYEIEIKLDLLK